MVEAKVSRPEIERSCNNFCSWLTFLSCWCSNIADDGSVKMERHLSTLLSLRRKERQICRTADMVPAVLYDSNVKVLLYLKIGQYMTNSSTLCTPNFWGGHFWSTAESRAYIIDLEVALADDLMKTARTESSVVLLPFSCMPWLIFSHFLFLKSLYIAHPPPPFFCPIIYKFHRIG